MEYDTFLENTLIAMYDDNQDGYIFDRLRFDMTMNDTRFRGYSFKLVTDNNCTYYSDSDSLVNKIKIHRAYLEYSGEKHLFVIGKQRVFFGVGRLWNPIDVFNPVDALAIESDEREGTESLRYEYAINELSQLTCVFSSKKNAVRLKGFMKFADLALVGVQDNDNDRDILGWEAEGELLETGLELRSEGGLFYDNDSDEYHTEVLVGAEYGFANSLTLLGEFLYNDNTQVHYFGLSGSYQLSVLVYLQLQTVVNLSDRSFGTMLTSEYSLSDEMGISGGLFLTSGDADDEFSELGNYLFLRWFVHF